MKMVTVLRSVEEPWFWTYIAVIWNVHFIRKLLEMAFLNTFALKLNTVIYFLRAFALGAVFHAVLTSTTDIWPNYSLALATC